MQITVEIWRAGIYNNAVALRGTGVSRVEEGAESTLHRIETRRDATSVHLGKSITTGPPREEKSGME